MHNPVVKFLYVLWFVPLFVSLTIVAGSLSLISSLFSIKFARYITNNWWSYIVFIPAGISLKTIGLENLPESEGGFIIFANHSSLTDIPTVSLSTGRQVSWVAKAALGKIPFFGWALARVHMLVDRGGGADSAKKMVEEAEIRLKGGEILSIFPEGTRNKTDQLVLPFKKGAFILAKHTGATMVPLAIKNASKIWPAGAFWPTPGTIRVKIGEPLQPKEGERLADLTARAQAALSELLADESW